MLIEHISSIYKVYSNYSIGNAQCIGITWMSVQSGKKITVSCPIFPKLASHPCDVTITFTKPRQSLVHNSKLDPVQFQLNPCNFK